MNSDTQTKSNRHNIGIIFLIIFIDLIGFSIIFPLYPAMLDYYLPMSQSSGGPLAWVIQKLQAITPATGQQASFYTYVLFGGILGFLYSFLQFIASPLWGSYSDRVGRKKVLTYTTIGTFLSHGIWVISGSFWMLVASRFIGGVMAGNVSVATAVIADCTDNKNRAKGMAVIGIAFGLGFTLGPAMGGLLSKINLVELYPGLAAYGVNPFSMPALVAFILVMGNLYWIKKQLSETLPEEKREKEVHIMSPWQRVRNILSVDHPAIARLLLVSFIFSTSFSGMEATLTFLTFERFAFSPVDNGYLFVLIGMCLIFTQGFVVRRFAATVGEGTLAKIGILCGVFAFIVMSYARSLPTLWLGAAFLAFGVALVNPTLSALVSFFSSPKTQGRHLGAFRAAGALARACGPLLAALAYFYWGSATTYLLGAIVLIPSMIVMLSLVRFNDELAQAKA